jgi:hypothetical protein
VVYVDLGSIPLGRMLMSHMIADTPEELHAMAAKIGVARKWLQHGGTPAEHFDICKAKRTLAIKHGASLVGPRALVAILRGKRTDAGERGTK